MRCGERLHRLEGRVQAMAPAVSPAVLMLPSQAPTEQEWEGNLCRLEGQWGSLGLIALPRKAASGEQWAAECRRTWEM